MPPKIKLLWVACIVVVFFGFVYISFVGKVDQARQKAEAKVNQQVRIKGKPKVKEIENKGRTFKIDPIKASSLIVPISPTNFLLIESVLSFTSLSPIIIIIGTLLISASLILAPIFSFLRSRLALMLLSLKSL